MRFLLVDRVLEFEPDRRMLALKNVTLESLYFEHHFPRYPVFPGVLIIEAMAQASGYFITRSIEEVDGRPNVFAMMTAANTRFIKSVRPGDQLRTASELVMRDHGMARTRVTAQVGDQVVSRSELSFALVDDLADEARRAFADHLLMLRQVLERGEGQP